MNSRGNRGFKKPEGPKGRHCYLAMIEMPHLRRSEFISVCPPTALRPWLFNAAPSALCGIPEI
jgi:hypothetical protein